MKKGCLFNKFSHCFTAENSIRLRMSRADRRARPSGEVEVATSAVFESLCGAVEVNRRLELVVLGAASQHTIAPDIGATSTRELQSIVAELAGVVPTGARRVGSAANPAYPSLSTTRPSTIAVFAAEPPAPVLNALAGACVLDADHSLEQGSGDAGQIIAQAKLLAHLALHAQFFGGVPLGAIREGLVANDSRGAGGTAFHVILPPFESVAEVLIPHLRASITSSMALSS